MRTVIIILSVFIIFESIVCWRLLDQNASLSIMNLIHQDKEKELTEKLEDMRKEK